MIIKKTLLCVFIILATSCAKNNFDELQLTEIYNSNTKAVVMHTDSSDTTKTKYGDFSFRGTHNSYSGGLRGSITSQLNAKMRFFELDLWPINSENIYSSNWTVKDRELATLQWNDDSYLANYSENNGQISIDRHNGTGLTNVYKSNWAEKHRVLTAMQWNGNSYLVNYSKDNGQISIDKFTGNGLTNVYKSNWVAKPRVLSTIKWGGHAYLVNYSKDNGHVSIDKFTGNGLSHVYTGIWAEKNRVLTTLERDDEIYLVNYSKDNGQISIDRFTGSGLKNVYTNQWVEKDRELASITLDGIPYLFNYRKDNGQISINGFNGEELYFVYQKEWQAQKRVFTSYNSSDKSYIINYRNDSGQISIDEFSFDFVIGHDYPSDEVAHITGNPSSNYLTDWVTLITGDMSEDDYPIFLMLELKEYKAWLYNGLWEKMIDQVEATLGSENVKYVASKAMLNGINRDTPIEDLMGKVVVYLEPNNDIMGDKSDLAKELKGFRQSRKYRSYDWRNYYDNIGALKDSMIADTKNKKMIRIFRMEEEGNYQSLHGNVHLNFAITDDPNNTNYITLTDSLNTVPK